MKLNKNNIQKQCCIKYCAIYVIIEIHTTGKLYLCVDVPVKMKY